MVRKRPITLSNGGVAQTRWAVINQATSAGYEIAPGANDGVADDFAKFDLAVQRYHSSEDVDQMPANADNDHVSDFIDGEDTFGQDVVVWYVAHLFHDIADKGRDWHEMGPNLVPLQVPRTPLPSPNGTPIS
jgi:hypothetical protein